jgi:hypothetical protein
MTKKLSELFELAQHEEIADSDILPKEEICGVTQEALDNLEKIDSALPQVRGLEASDNEMDELAELAVDSFKDLKELGMQVDSRYSSEIFAAAGTFLGHAITARTAKLNKKLRMIELQLKKAALDQKNAATNKELENTPLGEGKIIADRNELLKMLGQQAKDKDS